MGLRNHRLGTLGCVLAICSSALAAEEGKEPAPEDWRQVSVTLQTYCVGCHGPEKQKGKVRLDSLSLDLGDEKNHKTLWSVLDQLKDGNMPPEDKPQPKAGERSQAVAFLDTFLARAKAGGHDAPLRRLTRVQYRNTLRDLLGVDVTADPTASFPGDSAEHGFTTHAESLKVSSYLMNSYMEAADWALTAATRSGPRPVTKKVEADYSALGSPGAGMRDFADLYTASPVARALPKFKFLWRHFGRRYAPPPGGIRIRVEFTAEALNREIADPKIRDAYAGQGYRGSQRPFALGIYLVTGSKETARAKLVRAFDVPDSEKVSRSLEVWIPDNHTIALGFLNGPEISKLGTFLPKLDGLNQRKPEFKEAIAGMGIPKIRIHELTFEGPIYDQWPPASHAAIYGDGLNNAEIVKRFAKRAFRRPISDDAMRPFVELAGSDARSLREALIAVLCSPHFIYLREPVGELDDHAIASRLSYFLWNSMPDAELLQLAAVGRLKDPAALSGQLHRMLTDPRARSLTEDFVPQWLDFANISEMPPTGQEFRVFHKQGLQETMIGETSRFFQEILDRNLPVRNFIDSDFTFLNRNLAQLYGLDLNLGYGLEKVSLKEFPARGGLLGQGAVLTASANGVETSPVTRGVWVLENLLGTPPLPPPPDVPAADPDIRGALTVREILAKHRNDASCNSCHVKIDPHGFALENFDPIGRWRDLYPNEQSIESDGEIDGRSFDDIDEMKAILLGKEATVAKGLLTKLLEYGTGRKMGPGDRAEIDRLAAQAKARGHGLRDLFELAVTSRIFLTK